MPISDFDESFHWSSFDKEGPCFCPLEPILDFRDDRDDWSVPSLPTEDLSDDDWSVPSLSTEDLSVAY